MQLMCHREWLVCRQSVLCFKIYMLLTYHQHQWYFNYISLSVPSKNAARKQPFFQSSWMLLLLLPPSDCRHLWHTGSLIADIVCLTDANIRTNGWVLVVSLSINKIHWQRHCVIHGWCSSLAVRASDLRLEGRKFDPVGDAAAQNPWASCSHSVASDRSLQHVKVELVSHDTRENWSSEIHGSSSRWTILNIFLSEFTSCEMLFGSLFTSEEEVTVHYLACIFSSWQHLKADFWWCKMSKFCPYLGFLLGRDGSSRNSNDVQIRLAKILDPPSC